MQCLGICGSSLMCMGSTYTKVKGSSYTMSDRSWGSIRLGVP